MSGNAQQRRQSKRLHVRVTRAVRERMNSEITVAGRHQAIRHASELLDRNPAELVGHLHHGLREMPFAQRLALAWGVLFA